MNRNRIVPMDEDPGDPQVGLIASVAGLAGLLFGVALVLGIQSMNNDGRLERCRAAAVERLNSAADVSLDDLDRQLERTRTCRDYNRGALDMLEGLILPIDVD